MGIAEITAEDFVPDEVIGQGITIFDAGAWGET